jgi:DNA-binding GntR family transcriptional regulator
MIGKRSLVEVLRDAIRQGLLAPGTPLIQTAVADAFGVSRIPVREALQSLTAEGLVTLSPDGGAFVTSLTPSEIDELYSLRLLIEPALASPIVHRAGPAETGRLQALVLEMDAHDSDMEAWANANHAFHETLYAVSGKRQFQRICGQLLSLVEPYSRVAVFELAGQQQSQREHHQMIEAISRRDAEDLQALLTTHLERARSDLLDYVRSVKGFMPDAVSASDAAQRFAARLLQHSSMTAQMRTRAHQEPSPST